MYFGSYGMGMMYYDWTYILIMLPCFILALICSASVKSAFSKYSKVPNTRNMTGAQAAYAVLSANGVTGVTITHVSGNLFRKSLYGLRLPFMGKTRKCRQCPERGNQRALVASSYFFSHWAAFS